MAPHAPPLFASPLAAAVLSSLCPGLGQMRCGHVGRGLAWLLPALLLLPVGAALSAGPPGDGRLVLLVGAALGSVALSLGAVVDALLVARRAARSGRLSPWVSLALAATGLAAPAATSLGLDALGWRGYRMVESSMAPTLVPGDRVLARDLGGAALRRGDVVVFRAPGAPDQLYIKRVVGLPGDTVALRDGALVLEGVAREAAAPDAGLRRGGGPPAAPREAAPSAVPAGTCFLLGDGRDRSRDSRAFGPVPLADVLARVEYLFWPGDDWERAGALPPWALEPDPRAGR